jgi:hypothetical protein
MRVLLVTLPGDGHSKAEGGKSGTLVEVKLPARGVRE